MKPLDLFAHADALNGKPEDYFVDDANRPQPLVVEHATGRPKFTYDPESGELTPYPESPTLAEPQSVPTEGGSFRSGPAGFAFGGREG